MIALAIESSNTRGMGHLFRSFLIVEYLKERDIEFIYLINNDFESIRLLRERDIDYLIVDYSIEKYDWIMEIVESYNVSVWINDKFETSLNMAESIKNSGVFLALIDDIGAGEELADVNFVGLVSFSKTDFKSDNTRTGMQYVILNKEIDVYKRLRNGLNRILVTFGGSDPLHNTVEVVKELIKTDFTFDVTIGANNDSYKELIQLNNGRFGMYHDVSSLIELFNNYDLAFTGGGVTCCELLASGVPCIIIANAPHEENTGLWLQKSGGCIYAGNALGWDRAIVKNIPSLDIENMSKKGMKLFDTRAIERIFDEIFREIKYEQ